MKSILWGSWLKPRDSSGRESRTLFFVGFLMLLIFIALTVLIIKFIVGEVVEFNGFSQAFSLIASLAVPVMGIWLGREWMNTRSKGQKDGT